MATDRYTRVVLTIIAVALVWLCARDMLPVTVHAGAEQNAASLNQIDDRHPLSVKIVGVGRTQWIEATGPFDKVTRGLPWEPLPVREQ